MKLFSVLSAPDYGLSSSSEGEEKTSQQRDRERQWIKVAGTYLLEIRYLILAQHSSKKNLIYRY